MERVDFTPELLEKISEKRDRNILIRFLYPEHDNLSDSFIAINNTETPITFNGFHIEKNSFCWLNREALTSNLSLDKSRFERVVGTDYVKVTKSPPNIYIIGKTKKEISPEILQIEKDLFQDSSSWKELGVINEDVTDDVAFLSMAISVKNKALNHKESSRFKKWKGKTKYIDFWFIPNPRYQATTSSFQKVIDQLLEGSLLLMDNNLKDYMEKDFFIERGKK